jgi:hypothetical protein
MTNLNADVFQVTADITDSDYPWTVTRVAGRHHSVTRVSRRQNLFEVKLIEEAVVTPVPPGGSAEEGTDEFVDIWNDIF